MGIRADRYGVIGGSGWDPEKLGQDISVRYTNRPFSGW